MKTLTVNEAKTPTTRKERNKLIHAYILGCIDGEGYTNWSPTFTDKEKIKFLFDTFNSEVGNWNTPRVGEANAFREWCQGLPSSFSIEFENYRILELGKYWGLLSDSESERKEDNFIAQYWDRLYMNVKAIEKELNKPVKPTIYDIARLTSQTSPYYFSRDTLKFFHQRMSDFKVYRADGGKWLISAAMKDHTGRIVGNSQRLFNPITNELEHV